MNLEQDIHKFIAEKKNDVTVKDKITGWSKQEVARGIENGFSNADIQVIRKMKDTAFNQFLMQVAAVASEDYLKYIK